MKKIWHVGVVVTLLVLFALASCGGDKGHDSYQSISFTGTVTYFNLEGGFYAIAGDDGTNYDPTNLAPEYVVDGLRVHVDALVRDDLVSTHQIGPIIDIVNIQTI